MKNAIYFLLALIVAAGSAQGAGDYLEPLWNSSTKEIISGLAFADFGDGKLHVVAAGSSDGHVYNFNSAGLLEWEQGVRTHITSIAALNGGVLTGYMSNLVFIDKQGGKQGNYFGGMSMRDSVSRSIVPANLDSDPDLEAVYSLYDPSNCRTNKYVVGVEAGARITRIFQHPAPEQSFAQSIYPSDLDGDGVDEVVVGYVNRVSPVCKKVNEKESYIEVLNPDGSVRWTYKTDTAVYSVYSADVTGDGLPEVIAGTNIQLLILDSSGDKICGYPAGSVIVDIAGGDLDGDGKEEIVFASDNVYAVSGDCSLEWMGGTGSRAYDVDVGDLDGNGRAETVAASDRLYVFGPEGEKLFMGDSVGTMDYVSIGDLEEDGYQEVLTGQIRKITVYRPDVYTAVPEAEDIMKAAELDIQYGQRQAALEKARQALETYNRLGLSDRAAQVTRFIEDNGFSQDEVGAGMPRDQLALAYLTRARQFMDEGDCFNATRYGWKARYQFSGMNDADGVKNAKDVLDRALPKVMENASMELARARYLASQNRTDEAKAHGQVALDAYILAQDSAGKQDAQEFLESVRPVETPSQKFVKALSPPKGFDYRILLFIFVVCGFVVCLAVIYQFSRRKRLTGRMLKESSHAPAARRQPPRMPGSGTRKRKVHKVDVRRSGVNVGHHFTKRYNN